MSKIYKEFKKGQVIYADLGHRVAGVQGNFRPCVVVSRDESNHKYGPQITVCPLTTKLKDKPVHVRLKPMDVNGYHLRAISDFLPEDILTIGKSEVSGTIGYVCSDEVKEKMDMAMILQLGLLDTARKMLEEDNAVNVGD